MVNLNQLNTAKSAVALLASGVSVQITNVVIDAAMRNYCVTFADGTVQNYNKHGQNQYRAHNNIQRITEVDLPRVKGLFKKKPVGVLVQRIVSEEQKAEHTRIALSVSLYGYRGM